jgi:hypothetical protein
MLVEPRGDLVDLKTIQAGGLGWLSVLAVLALPIPPFGKPSKALAAGEIPHRSTPAAETLCLLAAPNETAPQHPFRSRSLRRRSHCQRMSCGALGSLVPEKPACR